MMIFFFLKKGVFLIKKIYIVKKLIGKFLNI